MTNQNPDSFRVRSTLEVGGRNYQYYSLRRLQEQGIAEVERLPYCLRVLLENLLRFEDGKAVDKGDIDALIHWDPKAAPEREIAFSPSRVVLQDFTGVPAIVDLAVMRDAMSDMGGDPSKINPLVPAELVIDHSVQVDAFGNPRAFQINLEREFERNFERYAFLRWGQTVFRNFRVVPPGTGIVHQVNLEYLGRVVFADETEDGWLAYPDTLVGTDSHTTMINGLGILGWGVGGIEAEAAMLGQPISLLIPQVVGFRLKGSLAEGATATDLVLTVTQMLRRKGVVGKFVEFFGPGLSKLSLADRATLGNMSPEFGSTCAISPIDEETIKYLRLTGRDEDSIRLVEQYARAQTLFHTADSREAEYSDTLELDLEDVVPSLAGPKRPQDRIALTDAKRAFATALETVFADITGKIPNSRLEDEGGVAVEVAPRRVAVRVTAEENAGEAAEFELEDGSVVIAAITSCTNTSNPQVMLGAGLLARNAVQRGLKRRPWVKTSLAPGSKVVTDYLDKAGLTESLHALGFDLVGYGCTTCIGNSGPLAQPVSDAIHEADLVVCSVLSGNRNFEGRINPDTRANYLASPPLVVAYALAGRMDIDLYNEPLAQNADGEDVYLRDIWPSQSEIQELIRSSVDQEMFQEKYSDVFSGDEHWRKLPIPEGDRFAWNQDSTYIRKPTFFDDMSPQPEPLENIQGMRCLAMLGDTVTTDHISPAGAIPHDGPAAKYLEDHGVEIRDFNSFGSRRGNHEVMVRGTFGNIRLRNLMVPGVEGGYTRIGASGDAVSIFEAAERYRKEGTPLLVIAGKEYGTGSSRDWAAKGTILLGVRAVLAESYERIHRSNLIGMGVLPLQFESGSNRESLELDGSETYSLEGLSDDLKPGQRLTMKVEGADGESRSFPVLVRIDTANEVTYYRNGGILHYVLRSLLGK